MNFLIALSFLFSLVALVLAVRAHLRMRAAVSVLESRSSRTVTIDHSDGRITVVKELKDPE